MNDKIDYLIDQLLNYHQEIFPGREITPGRDFIPHASKIIDRAEMNEGIRAVLDGWLTSGAKSLKFEKTLKEYIGVRSASLVNSGSSANLVALSALTSKTLGEARIQKGDEVITVAAGFPTTIYPIVQVGAIPVFVDISLPSYNVDITKLEEAYSNKTKAVMLAHTLGNPFNLREVSEFCKNHHIWLIEDNCDALGSEYLGQKTGSFGDLSTSSFYPAHHITTGEGGAVFTNSPKLRVLAESFRDWGRDCYCQPGQDDTCKKRFSQQHGTLPFGYDHKFVYGHIGYNLKMTDLQAAIGLAQIEKLPEFVTRRRENWNYLRAQFSDLESIYILPEAELESNPSWFGFALTLRQDAPEIRQKILLHLANKKIGTRLLFAGDMRSQPAFDEVDFRTVGSMENTVHVMKNTFWIGCWPGLNQNHLNYMAENIREATGIYF